MAELLLMIYMIPVLIVFSLLLRLVMWIIGKVIRLTWWLVKKRIDAGMESATFYRYDCYCQPACNRTKKLLSLPQGNKMPYLREVGRLSGV